MMDDNVNCPICKDKMIPQLDEIMKCNGSCLRKFHAKCLKITSNFLKQVKENKNVFVNCDDCASSPIMVLNETVKKMLSYLQIIDERIKRHDVEFEIIREELETNTEEVKTEINKVIDKIKSGQRADTTRKSNPMVVLQPKKSQKIEITKSELTEKIDPKSIGISDIHHISRGGIAINCSSSAETKKLKDEASEKMGENYTVKIAEARTVKVKVIGMSERLAENELKETIKKHKNFGAILEIDNECYNRIMLGEKLKIGWCRCGVTECIDVRRCYKCCGYNHKSSKCKNRLACLKCSGEHLMKDCGAKNCVCVNCKVAVEKLNIKLDIFHPAHSLQCPVYKRKLQNELKRIKINVK